MTDIPDSEGFSDYAGAEQRDRFRKKHQFTDEQYRNMAIAFMRERDKLSTEMPYIEWLECCIRAAVGAA